MKRPCEWDGLRRVCRFTRTKIGRRGAFLLFLALVDILYGYSMMVAGSPAIKLDLILDSTAWGWWWIATGIACLAGALLDRDRLFYGLAAFTKAAWAMTWVNVWIQDPAVPRAWVSVAIWGGFSGIVLVISTWPEVVFIKRTDTSPDGFPEVKGE